jgi:EPS-associated MarR family transcriptional regulator
MASSSHIKREEARLKVLRYVSEHPEASTRKIADAIGVSNGQGYYLVKALIDKGFVKFSNFTKAEKKSQYLYLLTASGIGEKLCLTEKFLEIKRTEYRLLRSEIEALSADLDDAALIHRTLD